MREKERREKEMTESGNQEV